MHIEAHVEALVEQPPAAIRRHFADRNRPGGKAWRGDAGHHRIDVTGHRNGTPYFRANGMKPDVQPVHFEIDRSRVSLFDVETEVRIWLKTPWACKAHG